MAHRIEIPCAAVCAAYRDGMSTTALAQRYACSPATVAKRLRACGITLRNARFQAITVDEERLRHLYLKERLPLAAIARELGVSVSTVGNRRRQYGIAVRGGKRREVGGE